MSFEIISGTFAIPHDSFGHTFAKYVVLTCRDPVDLVTSTIKVFNPNMPIATTIYNVNLL